MGVYFAENLREERQNERWQLAKKKGFNKGPERSSRLLTEGRGHRASRSHLHTLLASYVGTLGCIIASSTSNQPKTENPLSTKSICCVKLHFCASTAFFAREGRRCWRGWYTQRDIFFMMMRFFSVRYQQRQATTSRSNQYSTTFGLMGRLSLEFMAPSCALQQVRNVRPLNAGTFLHSNHATPIVS